jgi:hypothetical protein
MEAQVKKTVKHTQSFSAKDPAGRVQTLGVFQTYIDTGQGFIEGTAEIRTARGTHVNRIEKGKYVICDPAETPLTSDDPEAP